MSTDNPHGGTQPPPNQQDLAQRNDRGGRAGKFTVEFGDDCCRNFTITVPPLQGMDIRGRWDTSKMASRPQGMRDLGTLATRIPSPIPGAMLEVDVRRRKIRLFDPLRETEDGKKVLERYNAVAKSVPALRKDCTPFETVTYDLDEDQLKTLLLDLRRKLDSKCVTVIEGEMPTVEQIDSLKGDELYDPGNMGDDKPRYKKDLLAFKNRMRAAGV